MDFRSALPLRGRIFRLAALLLFGVILVNLFNLMIVQHKEYTRRAVSNRQVQLRQQAPRGRITDRAEESGLGDRIQLVCRDALHTKGILTDGGLLLGSMNLTYSGLELNEESVYYETSPDAIAKARVELQAYRSGQADAC